MAEVCSFGDAGSYVLRVVSSKDVQNNSMLLDDAWNHCVFAF
jgi:hypothetical protein